MRYDLSVRSVPGALENIHVLASVYRLADKVRFLYLSTVYQTVFQMKMNVGINVVEQLDILPAEFVFFYLV